MRVITSAQEMKAFSREVRAEGKSLALVPTMGALHEGHLALVRHARRQCDVVVVSIFVNPTQFGPGEDLSRYPRNLTTDLEFLQPLRVGAVFAPGEAEMYADRFETFLDPGALAAPFEGACRPGHFRGVATVVLKLLNVVTPEVAYFGQKDFQQALIVRRLVEDLNLSVRLVICPTVRERDGLAWSSRNALLNQEERRAATVLYRSLERARELVHGGEADAQKVIEEMRKVFAAEPHARLDYASIVEPTHLRTVERITAGTVALVAAKVGSTRLIDNVIFGPAGATPELLLQLAFTSAPVADAGVRIPGLDVESLRTRIEACRECAAFSSVLLPPREFLVKYLKRDYPDLNRVRTAVIGRDAPMNPQNLLYRSPEATNRFVRALYQLVGVRDFGEFRQRFVLTDAVRCHASGPRVPEKALEYCAQHLREEFKLFPNLDSVVVLGSDAYLQFQRFILGRSENGLKSFDELLSEQGWAAEEVSVAALGGHKLRAYYCYHPTYGYKRSPSIGHLLR